MLLGIDIGTTVLKVAVYNRRTGRLVSGCSRPIETTLTPDGGREQNPQFLSALLMNAMAQVREASGRNWRAISGIGLASQGGSTLIVRRQTGEPLTPLVLWNDPRAFPQLHKICSGHKPAFWRSFSLRDEPGMGLARIEWLRERDPDLLDDSNLYAGAGEFVYHFLTGQWAQDPCNALQIGCYDACSHRLTGKPLSKQGIPLSFFAPLRDGHASHPLEPKVASDLGLTPGIPVVGPYIDQEAGYMSTMGLSDNPLQVSLGTAWVGNFMVPAGVTPVSPFQLVVPAPAGKGQLVILPLLTGNVTWDWALQAFAGEDHHAALEKAESLFREKLLPPDGLVALPWINRPNPLTPGSNGALLFSGISPLCTPHDLLRACVVGMAYEWFRVLRGAFEQECVDGVILTGGASKGWQFQKLIACLAAPCPVWMAADQDWAGTRGALFAFRTPASRIHARQIKPLLKTQSERVRAGFQAYLQVFENLYGHEPAGRPFRIEQKRVDPPATGKGR